MLVTETDKVLEGIYQSGSEFLEAPLKNTWEFLGDMKDGFIDSVWRSTPQEIAEDAGELAFDVAISVPTGGAGKVVSGAAKGIGKIKYLDNLVDIGKISQKIPSLQGMPLPAGEGFLPPNLADDFLKAPYQMIKPDGEDVAKLTAKGDDVVKQGAKEVKKPDTIDSQKVIKEKSGKETGSGVQITDSVNKTEVKDIVEKTEVKNTAEETKVKKKIDSERGNKTLENDNTSTKRKGSIHQVEYGSTDLSKEAIKYRQENNIKGARNIAVFEYENNGKLNIIVGASQRNKGHAERLIAKELEDMGIQKAQVKRIYSELEPCSAPGGYCKRFLQEVFPQADITYSFEYGVTKISRSAGVKALKEAISKLFN